MVVRPQDGAKKQDCEPNAARRWLSRLGPHYAWLNPVYLGDDLCARQPMCADVLAVGGSFIFGCKPLSHKTLTEYLTGVALEGFSETVGVGTAKRIHRYRWMEGVPLRDGKDALAVNWLEIEISQPTGKVTYRNSFVTNMAVDKQSVAKMRLFEHIRTITAYLVFPSWGSLFRTIRTGRPPPQPP
ncbi:MAG: hypothetical protein K9G59_18490 [Caulobacter sp.]|nr:hypothetical protein [Caulobacter sp.]